MLCVFQALNNLDDQNPDVLAESHDEESSDEEKGFRASYAAYDKEKGRLDDAGK